MAPSKFDIVDYVVLGGLLGVSTSIGIYFLIVGRKRQTTTEYLLAGQRMNVFPVACSILASVISAFTLLGQPVETYFYGLHLAFLGPALIIGPAVTGLIFLPMFHNLKLTSINEYLELRFNRTVALLGSFAYIFQMELYMIIILYAPALTLNTVTGVSMEMCVLVVGLVCTFYTTIGGMKAVIWTDLFQVGVMFIGLSAVIVQGLIEAGGFSNVWEAGLRGKRTGYIDFDVSPFKRMTFWPAFIGGIFWAMAIFSNQTQVQRYLTQPTLRSARYTLAISAVGCALFTVLSSLVGVVIYARYEHCDPYSAGYIEKSDQIMPYFVMDTLAFLPGMPGIFVSGILSGTLSSMSSGFNSFSAIILKDIIAPVTTLSEARSAHVCRGISLVFGLITIGGAFGIGSSDNLIQIAMSFHGIVGGPVFGVFITGILCPFVDAKGVITGLVAGTAVMLWVIIGHFVTEPVSSSMLVLTTIACDAGSLNTTDLPFYLGLFAINTTMEPTPPCDYSETSLTETFYSTSYMWYITLGTFVTVVASNLASLYSGCQDVNELDRRTIFPPIGRLVFRNDKTKTPEETEMLDDLNSREAIADDRATFQLEQV